MKLSAHGMLRLLSALLLTSLTLAACTSGGPSRKAADDCPECPAAPAEKDEPEQPAAPPLERASWDELPAWADDRHAAAWPALMQSCSTLPQREPAWRPVCEAAKTLGSSPDDAEARVFFETHLHPWRTRAPDHTEQGLVTGYYEPLIEGSREPDSRYRWPVRGTPSDLLVVDLGEQYSELKHMRLRGRIDGRRIVPYWDRSEIEQLGSDLDAPVLFWAADPIELFFLQIQGSGQLRLPDGERVRIGYAEHNGHPYHSIGRWLVDQGEMELHQASMQGIKRWAAANPHRLRELLNVNPAYVFFRELPATGSGPLGALGVPLTPERSLAVDPQFIPLGAPVFLETTYPNSAAPLRRLMLAQDTGGAIKGVIRSDFYWGTGDDAGEAAGRMRQQGRMWVLLPRAFEP